MWDEEFNYEKPTNWWTNQDTMYTRIEKDTVSMEGNYSLKMVPSVGSSWQGCESLAGIRVNFDSVLEDNSVLTFYVKTVPEDFAEDSSVYLLIFGFTFNSDSVIGGFNWRTEIPIFDFERVDIPLPGENIDEMTIIIYGGAGTSPWDGPCLGRSITWLDEMTIDSRTSIQPLRSQEEIEFEVYPIPSTGVVTITGRDNQNIRYELYSLIGELIAKGEVDQGQLNIYNKGEYILKLYAGFDSRSIYSTRLVIVK